MINAKLYENYSDSDWEILDKEGFSNKSREDLIDFFVFSWRFNKLTPLMLSLISQAVCRIIDLDHQSKSKASSRHQNRLPIF